MNWLNVLTRWKHDRARQPAKVTGSSIVPAPMGPFDACPNCGTYRPAEAIGERHYCVKCGADRSEAFGIAAIRQQLKKANHALDIEAAIIAGCYAPDEKRRVLRAEVARPLFESLAVEALTSALAGSTIVSLRCLISTLEGLSARLGEPPCGSLEELLAATRESLLRSQQRESATNKQTCETAQEESWKGTLHVAREHVARARAASEITEAINWVGLDNTKDTRTLLDGLTVEKLLAVMKTSSAFSLGNLATTLESASKAFQRHNAPPPERLDELSRVVRAIATGKAEAEEFEKRAHPSYEVTPSGPRNGRLGYTTVLDHQRRRIYLFGGNSVLGMTEHSRADLWVCELPPGVDDVSGSTPWTHRPETNRWERLTPAGMPPPPRADHSAVWDPEGGKMYVFGGSEAWPSSCAFNDLWTYAPETSAWQQIAPLGTPPQSGCYEAVWDPGDRRILVLGRTGLWTFCTASSRWEELHPEGEPPPACRCRSAVWDADTQRLYVVCMWSQGEVWAFASETEIWVYVASANSWTHINSSGPTPPGHREYVALWDSTTHEIVAFGGFSWSDTSAEYNVWVYRFTTNSWERLPTSSKPAPNYSHTALWDAVRRKLYLFGFGEPAAKDLWTYVLPSPARQTAKSG